jgi:hypothetical protein
MNFLNTKAGAGLVVSAALLAGAYLLARKFLPQLLAETLNPLSDKNVAYSGTSAIVQSVTGDKDATLGGKLWEWFSPESFDTIRFKADINGRMVPDIVVSNQSGKRYRVNSDGSKTEIA